MLPGPQVFGDMVGALGIADSDTIVVYDGSGLYSAPRVWWTFRIFGAKNVFILDGGLPAWKAEGRPTEAGEGKRPPRNAEVVAFYRSVLLARAEESRRYEHNKNMKRENKDGALNDSTDEEGELIHRSLLAH